MTTIGAVVDAARRRLSAEPVGTPDLDARLLVAAALGVPVLRLLTDRDALVDAAAVERCKALLDRRIAGEPVDRILGEREFWGMPFRLNKATLSPRADTETVVEAALALVPDRNKALRILDLGTGSGALLVALLSELPHAFGVGVDLAPEAARLAADNARANGVGPRSHFLAGSWGDALAGGFDLIVSNPPYIESAVVGILEPEVRDHDPRLALDGGVDGLEAYRAVGLAAKRLLVDGGALVVELGAGQGEAVSLILWACGLHPVPDLRRDLGGIDRAITAFS